ILTRCLTTGTYGMSDVVQTYSPSMDIQVSSNFERLLFDLYDRDGKTIVQLMNDLKAKKSFTLSPAAHARLKELFASCSIDNDATLQPIADTYKTTGELLDPHTAVGLAAGQRSRRDTAAPLVVLATAHPAKFSDAVKKAIGVHPELPTYLAPIMQAKEKF